MKKRSKRFKKLLNTVDKKKKLSTKEIIELLKKNANAKFLCNPSDYYKNACEVFTDGIDDVNRIRCGMESPNNSPSSTKIQNGLGLAILSTNKGVMSDVEATKNNLGGEIICRIF